MITHSNIFPRIGIYAGAFDPVHAGHVAFALQAQKAADLHEVYFLPERQPRHKQGIEHFGHRTAMIRRAIRPHNNLGLLELPDIYFDVKRTWPKIKQEFPTASLVLLIGSDTVGHLHTWPGIGRLLQECELVIGLRGNDQESQVRQLLLQQDVKPQATTIIGSPTPYVASTAIRRALRNNQLQETGLLTSVQRYARKHWLYTSLEFEKAY